MTIMANAPLIPRQMFGNIIIDDKKRNAMLCIDDDMPSEATLHIWGNETEPSVRVAALTKIHSHEDSFSILEIAAVYQVDEGGGVRQVVLAQEANYLSGFSVKGIFSEDGFVGSWQHRDTADGGQMILSPLDSSQRIAAHQCDDWESFKSWAHEVHRDNDIQYFRGHGSNQFRLMTTFHRTGRSRLERYCGGVLPEFNLHAEALMAMRIDLNSKDDYSMMLGLAQHHGLPTPLLDWTLSPYIAAFFAFSDAIENRETRQSHTHVRIYGLRGAAVERLSPPVVILPYIAPYIAFLQISPRSNPRLYAQQGRFLVTNVAELEAFLVHHQEAGNSYFAAADVPIECAKDALQDLKFMGLTAATLFPGLDGIGRMLKQNMMFKDEASLADKPIVKSPEE